MDDYIQISKINDFIFCPYSIYLHSIYENFISTIYHGIAQTRGKIKHENIDTATYSTAKRYIQALSVYSTKYRLVGKIDIYDKIEKALIERKYKVTKVYDGYKYQLFAQYFCMLERGYKVEKLLIHSLSDNQRYKVKLPKVNELKNFEDIIESMRKFEPNNTSIEKLNIVPAKCQNCIYHNLCTYKRA